MQCAEEFSTKNTERETRMAARSIAKVSVSFGLVNVGIKIFKAAGSESVSFNMINPKTKNRVKQKLVDSITGEEIQRGDTMKGYEYAKDQYVCFTDDEVGNMQAAKKDTLEISEFVSMDQIDALHIEETYYTGPDKGMDKSYRLLYEMLKTKGRAAIGIWISHGKEHLVAIRAYQHGLIMHKMFYNTEVRAFEENCANIAISPIELTMAGVLMDALFNPTFDKSKYRDTFIEKLNAAVEVKVSGGTIKEVAAVVSNVGMEAALRKSLESMGVPASKIEEMLAQAQKDAAKIATPTPIAAPAPVAAAIPAAAIKAAPAKQTKKVTKARKAG